MNDTPTSWRNQATPNLLIIWGIIRVLCAIMGRSVLDDFFCANVELSMWIVYGITTLVVVKKITNLQSKNFTDLENIKTQVSVP